MTVASLSSSAPGAAGEPPPKSAAGAAKQFEALLLAQMLRSARESADQDDSTAETMFDVAGQQFAQVLANHGGIGLASMLAKSLTPAK